MATNKKDETAMVKAGENLPALVNGARATLTAISETLGGDTLSPFDLARIKVPTGGSKFWLVPSVENPDGVPSQVVRGVIVYTRLGRARWATAFSDSQGGSPPDCASADGITGHGDPGGSCLSCPFAQFGSAKDGRGGQECTAFRVLVMLTPESELPVVVTVPPSSLQNVKRYLLGLAPRTPWQVVTELSLVEAASKVGGIKYSKIAPRMVAALPEELRVAAAEWHDALKASQFTGDAVPREDVAG